MESYLAQTFPRLILEVLSFPAPAPLQTAQCRPYFPHDVEKGAYSAQVV